MTRRARFITSIVGISASLASFGCGSSSSALAPTSTPTPTTTSSFQNLVGDWSGTQSVAATSNRTTSSSITCNQAMSVTKQTDGTFSGTFAVTGNHPSCIYSGTVDSGTLTTAGVISAKLTTLVNAQTGCTRTQGDGIYKGTVTSTAVTMTMTMTERIDCLNPSETLDRTWTLSSVKK